MNDHELLVIDAHRHIWAVSERRYDWITPDLSALANDFTLEQSFEASEDLGIGGVVLVQAADTYEDTMYMLGQAKRAVQVRGIVAWAPLDRPDEVDAALDLYSHEPLIRGIRNLTHNYADREWILRADVAKSLGELARRGMTLDYVATTPDHLEAIVRVAAAHRDLTIVLDHLGSPPAGIGGWSQWAEAMTRISRHPNVAVKLSGLATRSLPAHWAPRDWEPAVGHVLAAFGASRLMFGSDWPVSTLSTSFSDAWNGHVELIIGLSAEERKDVLSRTALRVYGLAEGSADL